MPEQLRAVSALVVDDNAAARDILVHALDGVCARVDAVSSGEEAIAAVRQHDSDRPYDVIFMDWRMPGMDGIQAARLIKEDPSLKTHPAVVLVTAFGREEIREEAERIQMDGFLLKPVTASMLFDTLVALFAGASQDRTALAPLGDRHADRLRGLRVLLAEDNEINQQIAVELLEGVGATVEVANDGLDAVRKLLSQPMPPNVRRGADGPADAGNGWIPGDPGNPVGLAIRELSDHCHDGPRHDRGTAEVPGCGHERARVQAD